ncbi:MAG: hypothetical protein ACSLEX_01495 [Minisyncoccota bacterium]
MVRHERVGFSESCFINHHGHLVFSLRGLDFTGEEEILYLEGQRFRVSEQAKQMFRSKNFDGYDQHHRLIHDREYQVVLVPNKEVRQRTRVSLCAYAETLGYKQITRAGIHPRIREALSDEQLTVMDFWYIAVFHQPIRIENNRPYIFGSGRHGGGQRMGAGWDFPNAAWSVGGACAFYLKQE